jgi:hypothetical protein
VIESLKEYFDSEPCEDCVSRIEALNSLDKVENKDSWYRLTDVMKMIQNLPPVQPQQKTGHWIRVDNGKQIHLKDGMTVESVKCSECDEWLTASDEYACNGNYCPNCGCRMVEPQESESEK